MSKYSRPRCPWCDRVAGARVLTFDGPTWMAETFDESGRAWHLRCEAEALDRYPGQTLDEIATECLAA